MVKGLEHGPVSSISAWSGPRSISTAGADAREIKTEWAPSSWSLVWRVRIHRPEGQRLGLDQPSEHASGLPAQGAGVAASRATQKP